MDPTVPLVGAKGPTTLIDALQGRNQLTAYYFMWNSGKPAEEQ